jgi:hypothetical protein
MITLITGILIGIALCYVGSLISDIVKFHHFKAWLRSNNVDVNSLSQGDMSAALTAYNLRKVPNVTIDLVNHIDKTESKDVE